MGAPYFGQPSGGFFFSIARLIASCHPMSIFSRSGLGPGNTVLSVVTFFSSRFLFFTFAPVPALRLVPIQRGPGVAGGQVDILRCGAAMVGLGFPLPHQSGRANMHL